MYIYIYVIIYSVCKYASTPRALETPVEVLRPRCKLRRPTLCLGVALGRKFLTTEVEQWLSSVASSYRYIMRRADHHASRHEHVSFVLCPTVNIRYQIMPCPPFLCCSKSLSQISALSTSSLPTNLTQHHHPHSAQSDLRPADSLRLPNPRHHSFSAASPLVRR